LDSYTSFLPLHYLHTQYLLQLLSLPPLPSNFPPTLPQLTSGQSPESIQSKLVKADFTGILFRITSSRNHSLIGIKGIVIEETASTFRLVTRENKVKVIPKSGTMFTLSFPCYALPPGVPRVDGEVPDPSDVKGHIARYAHIEVDLLGSAFGFRSGERAGRKLKPAQGRGGGSGWGEEWVDGEWADLLRDLDNTTQRDTTGRLGEAKRRKRNRSRRKDPPAGGTLQEH